MISLVLAALIAAAMTVGLVILGVESHTATVVLLNWLLLCMCLFPGVRWFRGRRLSVPVFEAICLSYAMHFGVTGILLPNLYVSHFTDAGSLVTFTEDELAAALFAVVAGLAALQVAYVLIFSTRLGHFVPVVDVPLRQSRLEPYLLGAVGIGLVVALARAMAIAPSADSPIGQMVYVVNNQLTVAVVLLTYLTFGGSGNRRRYGLILGLALVGAVLIGVATAQAETILLIPFVVCVVAIQLGKRAVFVGLLVMAALYLFFLQPVKLAYRTLALNSPPTLDFVQRMALWSDATIAFIEGGGGSNSQSADPAFDAESLLKTGRASLQRVDYIHQFELIRLDTPDLLPYAGGATYNYFVLGWIPRLVWPDKPSALEDNNRLILAYGVLSENSSVTTTAGLGLLPEAYANFGDFGMVLIMALQGLVLAAVCRAFTASQRIGPQAVLLSVVVFLVNGVGGITAVMYGGLLQNLAAATLLLWLGAGRVPVIEWLPRFLRPAPNTG